MGSWRLLAVIALLALFTAVAHAVSAPVPWLDPAWKYRYQVNYTATLNYPPVRFVLSNGCSGADASTLYFCGKAKPDYTDLRVTDLNGNPLPFNVSKGMYLYVNTTKPFVVYFGNPSAPAPTWSNLPPYIFNDTCTSTAGYTIYKYDPNNDGKVYFTYTAGYGLNLTTTDPGGGYATWSGAYRTVNLGLANPVLTVKWMFSGTPSSTLAYCFNVQVTLANGTVVNIQFAAGGYECHAIPNSNKNIMVSLSMSSGTWYTHTLNLRSYVPLDIVKVNAYGPFSMVYGGTAKIYVANVTLQVPQSVSITSLSLDAYPADAYAWLGASGTVTVYDSSGNPLIGPFTIKYIKLLGLPSSSTVKLNSTVYGPASALSGAILLPVISPMQVTFTVQDYTGQGYQALLAFDQKGNLVHAQPLSILSQAVLNLSAYQSYTLAAWKPGTTRSIGLITVSQPNYQLQLFPVARTPPPPGSVQAWYNTSLKALQVSVSCVNPP
ncbi:MAG: hypothetical protein ACPLRU_05885, partial [Desulfofundulus sp.]